MADPVSIGADVWEGIKAVAVLATTVLAWLFKRQINRVDALEKAHNDLASKVMTKEDFTGAMSHLRMDVTGGLDRVVDEIRHQSTRIDGLYRKDGGHRE